MIKGAVFTFDGTLLIFMFIRDTIRVIISVAFGHRAKGKPQRSI